MDSREEALELALLKWKRQLFQLLYRSFLQRYLDRSTPHIVGRWLGTLAVTVIYALRVYCVEGFVLLSWMLGILLLNMLLSFMLPVVHEEAEELEASLPTTGSDEFKPPIPRTTEFNLWLFTTCAFCVAFVLTFFSILKVQVPVIWPWITVYWSFIFFRSLATQIGAPVHIQTRLF